MAMKPSRKAFIVEALSVEPSLGPPAPSITQSATPTASRTGSRSSTTLRVLRKNSLERSTVLGLRGSMLQSAREQAL